MEPVITSDVVVAYSQCPRKAYLLMFSPDTSEPHEYVRILEQERCENQERYIDRLRQKHAVVRPFSIENLRKGHDVLAKAHLQTDGLEAACSVLTRAEAKSALGKHSYEPTICVGTHTISKEQKLEIAFIGHVLGCIQNKIPMTGKIVGMSSRSHTVKLENGSKDLLPILEPLQEWIATDSVEPPPIILNKHCSLCPFQQPCQSQAEREDNLSLLNGVTPKVIRQYEKKGIFTVRQLSYLFKPRKRKKRSKNPPPVTHKVELQALAIREKKIYLQELPDVPRHPVELFLDLEGVPDRGLYYLIGLLVCQGDTIEHHSFWADTDQDEGRIWQQFVDKATQYPDAPIYHYGSYEPRAISTLARRYQTDSESLSKRLVNVNGHIYGKVYFPVRSNGLKDIGTFIGAKWTSPNASGLQSLVWRHCWEKTYQSNYKSMLLTYNEEDCYILKLLVDYMSKIQLSSGTLSEVDFADKRKQIGTEVGKEIHSQFDSVLKFAHFKYDKTKISFRQDTIGRESQNDRKGRQGYSSIIGHQKWKIKKKKVKKIIQVEEGKFCPDCGYEPLSRRSIGVERMITDLVLTKSGIRKTLTGYVGFQGYCIKCRKFYSPPDIRKYGKGQLYGHGYISWVVHQRIGLRMPYDSIREISQEYFNEMPSISTISGMINIAGQFYAETEKSIIQKLLESPFIHADETPINIRGSNQYAWVFTDGKYVIFKLSETREATIAHEFLADYDGVLISDFYPGYDSVRCRQQKCWVHLIRDLNNDLWGNPFDTEFEIFILKVRNLIIPIMETIQRYGLRKRNLNKFVKHVDRFYEETIINKHYHSETTLKYQLRFIRYRKSLFTFLEQDGIPWENNTAERALRHLTVQEKISNTFGKSNIEDYLRLLGVRQTCRFQGKSFFKFLFSGETDLDKFEARKRKR